MSIKGVLRQHRPLSIGAGTDGAAMFLNDNNNRTAVERVALSNATTNEFIRRSQTPAINTSIREPHMMTTRFPCVCKHRVEGEKERGTEKDRDTDRDRQTERKGEWERNREGRAMEREGEREEE